MIPASMRPGDLIGERFVVEHLAGVGGMGEVYRALDQSTGAHVALKVLRELNVESSERLAQESRVLETLSHPHIVKYVAHGVTSTGSPFLAMEWLDGESLTARLHRTGLRLDESVSLASHVAEALAVAHARGVVHRDIKPSNLFLEHGEISLVKVLDFGVAREHGGSRRLTLTGSIVGTPGYMAPEQARANKRVVDARADVFSLGTVLFECLTGRPAFEGEHAIAVLASLLLSDPPHVRTIRPDVPEVLDKLVARMLAKDPVRRPADGTAVATELHALLDLGLRPSVVPRVYSAPSITAREQQLVSVILVAQDAGGEDAAEAPTLVTDDQNARLGAMRDAAEPYGASVELVVAGAALATLTRAGVGTDHAARAARCALALRRVRPGVALVLATGRAMLGDRLPVGAVIDRAAERLRQMRAAGDTSLVIDEVTAGLLDARFELRGTREGQGFELVGERDATPTARTLLGRPTVFVGREREMAVLLGAWDACLAGPSAQAVLVTAPPGAGKTRLRQEFLRRLEARGAPAVWVAAADAVGARSPFGLVSRWVRGAAGLVEGERAEVRRNKLHARLARHLEGASLDRAAAFLGEVVGAHASDDLHVELRAARRDATLMGAQIRAAFTAWLAAESSAGPLVLVIEDLHWGDVASVRAVEEALVALGERPVMMLALARPEVRDEMPGAFETVGALSVALGPLPPRACERLARDALGDRVTDTAVSRAVARSEGNALYLEELVRALAEGDNGDALPESVLAMVAARLDRLDAQSRRVLRAASVYGLEFDERAVLALLGGSDRTTHVGDRLRELVAAEVLTRRGGGYTFRHALLRDASYALLTESDRALGHRLAAEHLVTLGEADAIVLAEHFAHGDKPELAAPWYCRAAEHALEGSALGEALTWAGRAYATGARGADLGAALRVEARVRSLRGENAEAARCGESALALVPKGSAAWYDAAADLATTSLRAGDRERLASLGRALAETEGAVAAAGSRVIALARAAIHLTQAGFEAAAARLRAALEAVSDAAGDEPSARAWRLRLQAVEALRAGDPSAYLTLTGRVVAEFEAAGDRASACSQRGNVGYALLELGAWARAVEVLRAALAEAVALGVHSTAGLIRHNLGLALALGGEVDAGRAVEREAADGFARQGDRRLEGFARSYLARIEALGGDLVAAEGEAVRATELLVEVPPSRAYALAVLAEVRLAAGDVVGARAAAREAAAALDALGAMEEGEALIRLADAETRWATGDAAGAARVIAEAARKLREHAARVSDAALRETFLREVPENARTLALAEAWGAGGEASAEGE
jgi:hypothetical protein